MTKRKRLFFDIETSFNIGIFWRSGYNQTINPEDIIHERAVICVSYKWEGEDEVHTLTWDRNQSDKKLLTEFIKIMNKANEVVGHNGDRFDIKWLRTRCLFHRLPMFPKYQSIDTLKLSKAQFNFNSNKLDYIAKFLGVGSKLKHEGLDLWKSIVLNNDQEALDKMIEYCENDVVILEKVYNEIKNYTTPKFNYATLNGDDKWQCPECGGVKVTHNKTYTTAMGTVRRHMRCRSVGCGVSYNISNKSYEKLIQWRAQNNLK